MKRVRNRAWLIFIPCFLLGVIVLMPGSAVSVITTLRKMDRDVNYG